MKLEELKDKKILILGFGREGQDSFLALRWLFPEKVKNKTIAIADQQCLGVRHPNIEKRFGRNYLEKIKEYDVVIKTPGIPLAKLNVFLKKGRRVVQVTSQTEIFFNNFKGTIIGVTGTKGKGTVASLIYEILKKAGQKVELGGNIGQPVLQSLLKMKKRGEGTIFVYELSSHQLQGLRKSPHIAVFTNLFPDHLDYYKDLGEYQRAKQNITKYQGKNDLFIYNAREPKLVKMGQMTKAKKRPIREPNTAFESHLRGNFNQLNIALAVETARVLGVSEKVIKEAVKQFKGLAHRLEFIGRFKGIEFYNDSMSTIPETAIAALDALKPNVGTLLIGGSDKGSDYQELAKAIAKSKINTLIVLGKGTGQKIWQFLEKEKSKPKKFLVNDMAKAVEIAFEQGGRGEVCLLSPASASFNLFKSYQERGDLFKKFVKLYAQKKRKKN